MNKLSLLGVVLAVIALFIALSPRSGESEKKETAFERVMRTRTLRCAYAQRPPYLTIDPNTKEIKGISHDVMEAIGRVAGIKIVWQEEVGYGAFPEQLRQGKEDAFCLTMWASTRRAERVELTVPVVYSPLYFYVREGDSRFDNKREAINDPHVTITLIDGSAQVAVMDASFPLTKRNALPSDSDGSQVLLGLATKKSDIVLSEVPFTEDFNKNNPTMKIRKVVSANPVRTFGESFSVAKGEWELRDVLNTAIHELEGDGTIDRILSHYTLSPGSIVKPSKAFSDY